QADGEQGRHDVPQTAVGAVWPGETGLEKVVHCVDAFRAPENGDSQRCKAKGVPSAANHNEYARRSRERQRGAEIAKAREILANSPRSERMTRLQQAFPRKLRRQHLYLLRKTMEGG